MSGRQKDLEKMAWAIYEEGNADPQGFAIGHDKVDLESLPTFTDWLFCEGQIEDDRLDAPVDGSAKPTTEELEMLKDHHLRLSFEHPGDNTTGVYFCTTSAEGVPPILVLLSSGHHSTGLYGHFFGAFDDEETAFAALREGFYLQDDY